MPVMNLWNSADVERQYKEYRPRYKNYQDYINAVNNGEITLPGIPSPTQKVTTTTPGITVPGGTSPDAPGVTTTRYTPWPNTPSTSPVPSITASKAPDAVREAFIKSYEPTIQEGINRITSQVSPYMTGARGGRIAAEVYKPYVTALANYDVEKAKTEAEKATPEYQMGLQERIIAALAPYATSAGATPAAKSMFENAFQKYSAAAGLNQGTVTPNPSVPNTNVGTPIVGGNLLPTTSNEALNAQLTAFERKPNKTEADYANANAIATKLWGPSEVPYYTQSAAEKNAPMFSRAEAKLTGMANQIGALKTKLRSGEFPINKIRETFRDKFDQILNNLSATEAMAKAEGATEAEFQAFNNAMKEFENFMAASSQIP